MIINNNLIYSFVSGFIIALVFDYIIRRYYKLGILDQVHTVLSSVDIIDPQLKIQVNEAISRNDVALTIKLLADFAHSTAYEHANSLGNQLKESISKDNIIRLIKQGAEVAGCDIELWLPKIDNTDQASANQDDLLLAFKALGLCYISYNTSDVHPELVELEKQWVAAMLITDYQTWHSVELTSLSTSTKIAKMVRELSHGALYKVTGGEVGGAEAITGYISNLAPGFIEPMPFICFRGTQSHSDALNNVICLVTEDFYSHKGTLIGKTGLGFINHYHSLCQLRKNIDNKETGIFDLIIERGLKSKQGILICGHSLGAAIGLLLAAELHTDYGDSIPIHLVTFGSPRIFDKETSSRVHKFDLRHHMRFINSGDLVTVLGEQSTIPLTHSGIPYIFPPIITSDDSQSDDLIVIHESNSFDWSLRPPDIGRATLTFAAAEGRYHRLKGNGGYFHRFRQCKAFIQSLKSLDTDLDITFKQILDLLE
mmetsp:Transcript_7663/g.6855  ORF Transcript_7663/g.6855 Transcript_7663/m.6855 type:complete len:483 (-) Transcript_7663:167-1615(-)